MKNKKGFVIAVLFAGMFLFGLLQVPEAGVYFDEKPEQQILSMNILQYSETFHIDKVASYFRGRGVIPICESVERDHGIAPYYPFAIGLFLFDGQPEQLSFFWHLYTYFLFFFGVIYLYRLLYELFECRKTAFLGAAMLFFTPKIFADGLYNNKDSVLLSLVLVMLFYGMRFVRKKNFGSALFLGMAAGFACNLKISGIYVFAGIGLLYLFEVTMEKQWNRRNFLVGAAAAGTGFLCYLLLTPAIWGQGFALFDFLKWNLDNAVNFSRLDGTVLFEGEMYRHSDKPLPWYYLPKIMALTIPFYITLLAACSFILWIRNLLAGKERRYLFFLLTAVIPVLVAMVGNPNIYNGWRHFYFLYGPVIVLAAYGVFYLIRFRKTGRIFTVLLCLLLFVQAAGIAKNGIYSVAYTNFLAGRDAGGVYELDYYGVTAKKVLMDLASKTKEAAVLSDSKGAVLVNYEVLPQEIKEKIRLVFNEEDIREAQGEEIPVFSFVNTSYDMAGVEEDMAEEAGEEVIYRAWGNTFVRLILNGKD